MAEDAGERLVAGRWTLHTPLRRARRGVVWRATEVATGRRLAVEQLPLPERADPAAPGQAALWDRVAADARTAASLAAPGLVPLEDVVVEDGVVYVAAELVEGRTLDELVAGHGPLPVRRVAQLGLELLDALEAARTAGLVHLDLRPASVLVTADGRARLTGVGLAALRTGLLAGPERATGAFPAPEQLRSDPAGPPADLWSLGIDLWFAVEGEPPFTAGDADATVTAILGRSPRPTRRAGPLAPILHALLTKPPGGRPTRAEARRLLQPLAGASRPAAGWPTAGAGEQRGQPEGERSRWRDLAASAVHRSLGRVWGAASALDPVVRRVALVAGGSVLLALVSFAVAVAVSGDPLGLRAQAVAPAAVTAPPTTVAPPTTAPTTTVAPSTTAVAVVPPGWSVHADPATGYQVAVPPGWQITSDGPRTELRDQSSPTFLRIDWVQDPQADPLTVEQQASQAHAGEHGGYAPARLEPTQFKGLPAALLEFTYQDGETWHALELGVRSPRHHVAMAIYARDRDWGAGWALFEAFKASFVPPAA
jgi:eukaryotic-like serine/threonine-protein kinase